MHLPQFEDILNLAWRIRNPTPVTPIEGASGACAKPYSWSPKEG
jgi:hypothetical protein